MRHVVYVFGGLLTLAVITNALGFAWLSEAADAGKLQLFVLSGNALTERSTLLP
jgi:hypothetical protein